MKITDRISLIRVFLAMLALDALLILSNVAPGFSALLSFVVLSIGAFLSVRLARYLLRKSIWRLRNRLYVTYVFIGVVPLVLLVMLSLAGMWIVVGQVAVYLVSSELERSAALLSGPAESIANADDPAMAISNLDPTVRKRLAGFEVQVSGDKDFHFPAASKLDEPGNLGDYTGFVRSKGRVYLWHCHTTPGGRHIVVARVLSPKLMEKLAPPLGTVTLVDSKMHSDPSGKLPIPYNALDFSIFWSNPLNVKPEEAGNAMNLGVETRPSAVLNAVFASRLDNGQVAMVSFILIATLLFMTELISLIIGISLTRTITGAVHEIYEGTLKIAAGNFSYRIPVKGADQLAGLGNSFNEMSARIEQLVVIAKEKERMESELEIATQVQNQLFPRSAPTMNTVRVNGLCRPARSVSGDYYDYLKLPDGNLAFALGDVAGKGISAALLMASIQSIMRTQLAAGLPAHHSTKGIVAQLNKQLYANTSPEKYATFFFGLYDDKSRVLTYTNAGHLQPLLFHRGEAKQLEVTGTVVGAFPSVPYGEETIQIASGDLLVAYTDGISEPENAYGEEFGEQRLADTVLKLQHCEPGEIAAKVMEAVCQWSSAPELPDDMTILIAQGIGA